MELAFGSRAMVRSKRRAIDGLLCPLEHHSVVHDTYSTSNIGRRVARKGAPGTARLKVDRSIPNIDPDSTVLKILYGLAECRGVRLLCLRMDNESRAKRSVEHVVCKGNSVLEVGGHVGTR